MLGNIIYRAVLSRGEYLVSKKEHDPSKEVDCPSLIACNKGGFGLTLSGVRASGVVDSLEFGLRPKYKNGNKIYELSLIKHYNITKYLNNNRPV